MSNPLRNTLSDSSSLEVLVPSLSRVSTVSSSASTQRSSAGYDGTHDDSDARDMSSSVQKLYTISSTFSQEKWRGLLTSIASGVTTGGIYVASLELLGMSFIVSTVAILYGFGSVFSYSLDILFAKRDFRVRSYNGQSRYEGPVPYGAFGVRFAWLCKSFISKQFFRYVVTILIDTLMGLALLQAGINALDRNNILMGNSWRNSALAIFITIFTFFLYSNVLKFDWAYRDGDDPLMNIVVLMWSTIVLMIYASTTGMKEKDPASTSPPERQSTVDASVRTGLFSSSSASMSSHASAGHRDEDDDEDDDEDAKKETFVENKKGIEKKGSSSASPPLGLFHSHIAM